MKILIAADMEGISGVTNWDQVTPGHAEYQRFRRTMTADVNAAVQGAFEGGAKEVTVSDGHWNSSNILIEELNPRARLNSGTPSPFSMVEGVQHGVDGAMFIGYHARAGTQDAILDHTWSSRCVANVWLNELLVGETGLNAALCGHFDVPVLLVSGDQSLCAEASELLGALETVVVKRASGRMAADCLTPQAAQELIRKAAVQAVRRLADGHAPPPLRLPPPVKVVVELIYSEMADKAALLPGARRIDGRRVEFSAADMPAAYQSFRAAVGLARS
ncbi:MAG: M55 family metallopeptidase [Anaerolineales bacterium]